MAKERNPPSTRRSLNSAEWTLAVDQYELGHANCSDLAAAFGISRQAMAKGLQKRGARKGKRVAEVVADLHRKLDESDHARLQWAIERQRGINALLKSFVAATNQPSLVI